jgi:acetyl esterase/lipase
MATSPQLRELIKFLRSTAAEPRSTVEEARASYELRMSSLKLDPDVKTERVGAGGVPAEWVSAPGADEDRVLLYLHGGYYAMGSMRTHRVYLSRLSRASGCRVLGLDYRRAPENPFPAAGEDTVAAYRWLLANGTDPRKITIGGESAGGGLTVSACVGLRYMGDPMPGAAVCLSSWADLAHTGESMTTNARADPTVTLERAREMAALYLAGKDPRTPLASPIYADLHGLPPMLIMVGSIEVLRDDSVRLAQRAQDAGVDATLEIWDDMPHNWPMYAHVLPEGQQAIDRIGEFIRSHTA